MGPGSVHPHPLVRMENIHKWFGHVYALRGVNFYLDHDEIVGIVGDNGAGKSTLIKILSGLYPADQGRIYLEDREVHFSSPSDAMQAGIETIHQDVALVPEMSIARNIFMGRELTRRLGFLDLSRMSFDSARPLAEIGLSVKSPDTPVDELSGGERQGVAISRAMYFKAKFLILDEPTNNLSVKESAKVLDFVRDAKKRGVSSIFITHNLHHVYGIADRLVVMSHGKDVGTFKKDETSIEHLTNLIVSA